LAGPTNTEKIDELTKLVSSIYPRIEFFQRDLDRLSAVKSETRIAVLEEKIAKYEKAIQESDRKRWMLTIAFIGSVLTLAGNILITVIRK
jgi:hypothetical protein